MDLGKIEQNIKEHRYTSVAVFSRDVKQVLINSQIYNGLMSPYTEKATEIVQMADSLIEKHKANLAELETNIQRAMFLNSGAGDDIQSQASGEINDSMAEALFSSQIVSNSAPHFTLGDDETSQHTQQDQIMPDEELWRTGFGNPGMATDEEETRNHLII